MRDLRKPASAGDPPGPAPFAPIEERFGPDLVFSDPATGRSPAERRQDRREPPPTERGIQGLTGTVRDNNSYRERTAGRTSRNRRPGTGPDGFPKAHVPWLAGPARGRRPGTAPLCPKDGPGPLTALPGRSPASRGPPRCRQSPSGPGTGPRGLLRQDLPAWACTLPCARTAHPRTVSGALARDRIVGRRRESRVPNIGGNLPAGLSGRRTAPGRLPVMAPHPRKGGAGRPDCVRDPESGRSPSPSGVAPDTVSGRKVRQGARVSRGRVGAPWRLPAPCSLRTRTLAGRFPASQSCASLRTAGACRSPPGALRQAVPCLFMSRLHYVRNFVNRACDFRAG